MANQNKVPFWNDSDNWVYLGIACTVMSIALGTAIFGAGWGHILGGIAGLFAFAISVIAYKIYDQPILVAIGVIAAGVCLMTIG